MSLQKISVMLNAMLLLGVGVLLLSTASVSLSNSNNDDIYQYPNLLDEDFLEGENDYEYQQPLDNYPIDDYNNDFEKFEMVRGMPAHNKKAVTVKCKTVRKGPITIGDNFHPPRYYNIACEPFPEKLELYHHQGSGHSYEYCESPRDHCITVHKEMTVFKRSDGQKNCWKPNGTIQVEAGCQCRKHYK